MRCVGALRGKLSSLRQYVIAKRVLNSAEKCPTTIDPAMHELQAVGLQLSSLIIEICIARDCTGEGRSA